jgi:hypothetical protein
LVPPLLGGAATRKPTNYDANWKPLDSDVKTLQEWQSIKREKERERAQAESQTRRSRRPVDHFNFDVFANTL